MDHLFWTALAGVVSLLAGLVIWQRLARPDKSQLLELLMNEICSALSSKEVYFRGPRAPSFFVMYAHDSPNYGRADDRIVKSFLGYLEKIGCKAQSDRNPVITHQSPDLSSAAWQDILENQFCLLPKGFTTNSVDKVLLCFSEVFYVYCSDPRGKEYVKRVVKAGLEKAKKFEGHDDCISKTQKAIHDVVADSIEKDNGFHHVLTEIALLQLRILLAEDKSKEKDASNVVLVDLHHTDNIFKAMPFLKKTIHCLTLQPVDPIEASHKLFFTILNRIYQPGLPPLMGALERLYEHLILELRSQEWPLYEFRSKVLDEINKALATAELFTHPRHGHVDSAAHANDRRTPQIDETYTELEKKCFDKLRFTGMENRQEDVIESIDLTGTCEWILMAPEFTQWRSRQDLDKTNCQLWIKGHPGTGKSVATRKVLETVKQKEEKTGTAATVLSYFFHGRSSEPLDKSMMGMLRTLIHQLLRKEARLRSEFAKEYKERFDTQGTDWEWHQSELTRFLLSMVAKPRPRPIRLIIDAIDECEPSEVTEVVDFLNAMVHKLDAECDLSMCISMRHDTAISNQDGEKLEIIMETRNGNDIWGHVYGKLKMEKKLAKEICRRASNNFLWAGLVVKRVQASLRKAEGHAKAMKLARQLPKQIEDLFGELVSGLDDEEKQEACILFQWALFGSHHFDPARSYKHLMALQYVMLFSTEKYTSFHRLHEEQGQLDIHQFSKRINFLSGGLVECIDQSSELPSSESPTGPPQSTSPAERIYARNITLQVIHESVKEWFLDKGCKLVDKDLSSANIAVQSHISLMKCLITYLSATDISEMWTDSGISRDIALSAANDIFFRAHQVENQGQLPYNLVDSLSTDSAFWKNLQSMDPWQLAGLDHRGRYPLVSPLNMFCYLGLTATVCHLLDDGYWIDKLDHGTVVSAIQSHRIDILKAVLGVYEHQETDVDEDNLCRIVAEEWGITEQPEVPTFVHWSLHKPTTWGGLDDQGIFLSMLGLLCEKGVQIRPLFDWLTRDDNMKHYKLYLVDTTHAIMRDERVAQSVSWDTEGKLLLASLHRAVYQVRRIGIRNEKDQRLLYDVIQEVDNRARLLKSFAPEERSLLRQRHLKPMDWKDGLYYFESD